MGPHTKTSPRGCHLHLFFVGLLWVLPGARVKSQNHTMSWVGRDSEGSVQLLAPHSTTHSDPQCAQGWVYLRVCSMYAQMRSTFSIAFCHFPISRTQRPLPSSCHPQHKHMCSQLTKAPCCVLAAQIAEGMLLYAGKSSRGSWWGWPTGKKRLHSSDHLLAMNNSVCLCCEAELNTEHCHNEMSKQRALFTPNTRKYYLLSLIIFHTKPQPILYVVRKSNWRMRAQNYHPFPQVSFLSADTGWNGKEEMCHCPTASLPQLTDPQHKKRSVV